MAIDYCSADEAFAYGGSAGASVDPIDERGVMAEIVTAASRAIDSHCRQAFSRETYAGQRLRGVIDADGVLVCSPPLPTIVSLSALEYRVAPATAWLSAPLADVDVEETGHGCTVRWLSAGLTASRGRRVDVRLSYTGGYASRDELPADLRWAARAVAWYEYQRRSAPLDKTAIQSMGIVVIPGDWPKHITSRLAPYAKVTPT